MLPVDASEEETPPQGGVQEDGKPPGRLSRATAKAKEARAAGETWLEEHREGVVPLDIGVRLFERDADIGGSVLSSALAYRLFLFAIPLALFVVALVGFGVADEAATDTTEDLGLGQSFAGAISSALEASDRGHWIAVFIGLYGILWTGRSLSKVFIAVSARSWQVPLLGLTTPIRTISIILLLVCSALASSRLYRWLSEEAGAVGGVAGLLTVFALFATVWFLAFLSLPHRGDPSGLLPGIAVLAVTNTFLLWFSRFYLPSRLARASDVYGAFATVTVALAWLFLFSRIFVLASSLNAVLWERFGSIGGFVFGLPVLRAIPRRFPKVRSFFGVDLE
jgi:uncharacterized BrkB/YihY/UPF0761 family membrane protein